MHWYLTGNYTPEAMKALDKKPSDRHEATRKLVTAGKVQHESFRTARQNA
jgi:hypothetical protein